MELLNMSTIGTAAGLALAAAGAFIVVMLTKDLVNPSLSTSGAEAGNVSLLDGDGPDVQFIVFFKNQKTYNLKNGDTTNFSKVFNVSQPVKIVIHGFTSNVAAEVVQIITNAYLKTGDYNVIGVDWSVLCNMEYISAMRGVQLAGEALAGFIRWLNSMGVSMSNIHIVGHSLGAHVAGVAGDKLNVKLVGRITGLDPAGPGYTDIPKKYRLDKGDAKLVDVIHTFMKVLSLAEPLGHVDFYPNGGRFQPGCPDIYDVWNISESLQCNHARAYYLFAETIYNPRAFKTKRCKSVDEALAGHCFEDIGVCMGNTDTYKHGLYYLKTRDRPPYYYK